MPSTAVRVKLDWDGGLRTENGLVAPDGFDEFVRDLLSAAEGCLLYREGYGLKPAEAQLATLQRLAAAKVKIFDPVMAPPEWGELETFELEITPDVLRVSASRAGDLLVGDEATFVVHDGGDGALPGFSFLISCHRLVEEGMNDPNLAFDEAVMEKPGTHLRFSFGGEKIFASHWKPGAAPGRVTRFIDALKLMAARMAPAPQKP